MVNQVKGGGLQLTVTNLDQLSGGIFSGSGEVVVELVKIWLYKSNNGNSSKMQNCTVQMK